MKKFFAAFAATLALAGAAPAHAAAAAPAPAAQAPVDPQVSAAVKAMFESMKYRELMGNLFKQMEANIPNSIRMSFTAAINNDPRLDAKAKKAKLAELEEKVLPAATSAVHELLSDPKLTDEIVNAMVPVYARTYTLDEVRQLSAFYKSPVGHKMLATMPQLMSESTVVTNAILAPRINKLMQSIVQGKH